MKKISVVILNWNGAEMLRKFLPSVIEYSISDQVEVCVADNGSTDSSVAVITDEFPQVRLIQLDKNYGFADGYNIALKHLEAEYVVLLNSDVEVTDSWLDAMSCYLDKNKDVAACQPKILSYKNREYFEYAGACGGYMDQFGYPFCRGRIFNSVEKDRGQYDTVVDVMWATGASLFIRLEDYRNVGGLDGRFFAHMEEIDLCWRLRSRGRRIVCVPQSVVYHVGGATLKKENPRKTFLNFRNNLIMLYKNTPEKRLKKVMQVRGILDYVAVAMFLLKGDSSNAKAVLSARKEYGKMKHDFEADRKNNQALSTSDTIKEIVPYSIIKRYYINGKKIFAEL